MRIERWLAAVGVVMVAAGCGNGDEASDGPAPSVIGEWNPGTSGEENHGQYLFHLSSSTTLAFLRLDEDGTGFAILQNMAFVKDRVSLTWGAEGDDGVIWIQVPSLTFFARFDVGFQGDAMSLRHRETDETFGFWREPSQPMSVEEADLAEYLTAFSSPIHPATTLVGDGAKLWYEIYGYQLVEYDATSATVHPADPTYSHPVAMQGGDFWMTCTACPNSKKLQRRSQANELVAEVDLANRIQGAITSAHWDGGSFWIADAGVSNGDPQTALLRFDPAFDSAPQVRYVGTRVEAFTFHQGRLFAITYLPTPVLIEVDAEEHAVKSLELPEDVHWQGLASKGGKLHMLGGGVNGFPVTVTVENP